jgi:tetratricopeptide (TPR) repeat protein
VNNQAVSKEILNIITDSPQTIDDDIYQLTKFALLLNIDNDELNPVFEMHDVVATKLLEIHSSQNRKELEAIADKMLNAFPKTVVRAHLFRIAKTVFENLQVIEQNGKKQEISIYKMMGLNLQILIRYINNFANDDALSIIEWFNQADKANKFHLSEMNNDERARYGVFLEMIGIYFRNKKADWDTSLAYFIRSDKAFAKISDYEAFKSNNLYMLAVNYIVLGHLQKAQQVIETIEQLFAQDLVDKTDITFLHFAKTYLMVNQGNYLQALEQNTQSIKTFLDNGLKPDDLSFTTRYLLRTQILCALGQYQQAKQQAMQLLEMYSSKGQTHEMFSAIFIAMATAELGLQDLDQTSNYIDKALEVLNFNGQSNTKDTKMAALLTVKGDLLVMQKNHKEAAECYQKAAQIYENFYQERWRYVACVKELYQKISNLQQN